MPTVQLGSATLHYREAGGGTDVALLLHAFPLHSGMWAPQLAALAPGWRILAPDYRGLGESRGAGDATTMDLIAEDVLGLLRQLGVRRAAVAGLSMGGYVALELYRRAPRLFRGLALCDTKAGPDTEAQKDVREKFAVNALAKGLGWVADDFTPKLLRETAPPALAEQVKEIIRGGTPEGVAAAQRGMARRKDSLPTLPLITCPTLVMCGDEDRLAPPAESQRMASLVKGARLLHIPAAGHLSNLENPSAFNTALTSFFASLPA
jgi:pimeloyl-ACP methyl ester carboxylesterase